MTDYMPEYKNLRDALNELLEGFHFGKIKTTWGADLYRVKVNGEIISLTYNPHIGYQLNIENMRLKIHKHLQKYNEKHRQELYVYDAPKISALKSIADMACGEGDGDGEHTQSNRIILEITVCVIISIAILIFMESA